MKNIFLSIVFVLIAGYVFAGNEGKEKDDSGTGKATAAQMISISGQVLDIQTGEVLTGVEVEIEGIDAKAYTDFDGNFTIDNIAPGKYNLIASLISYKKSLLEGYNLDINSNHVEIKLEISK